MIMETSQLRAGFARSLSQMYGSEVPAYHTLVAVAGEVNAAVLAADPVRAQRLGRIDRVTAERHGAIRVGTATELAQVSRLFAAFGMAPVGYYDLRGAEATSLPVVATAFRPITAAELAANPFRVFCSVLVADDRRYFDPETTAQLTEFLAQRQLFPPELLQLADRAAAEGGLAADAAQLLISQATDVFRLSREPVDRTWYDKLAAISGVAADIGGVRHTHINHLTPRVLDIDELYQKMRDRGITMIDEIQGPPAWRGPDVLLRQTSFKALPEVRNFVGAGVVYQDQLRVRFGEVEARGIALTASGRDLYDQLLARVDERAAGRPRTELPAIKTAVWEEYLPPTERGLLASGLGFFTFSVGQTSGEPPADLLAALDGGWVRADPIVYEDFLPRSAAGIFASNLDQSGKWDESRAGVARGPDWLSEVIGQQVSDPVELYREQSLTSLAHLSQELGRPLTLPGELT